MQNHSNLRHTITVYVILFYFFPILLYTFYSTGWMPWANSWQILSTGLLMASLGSIAIILKMWGWQNAMMEEIQIIADAKTGTLPKQKAELFETANESIPEDYTEIENPAVTEYLGPSEDERDALRQLQLLQVELEATQQQEAKLKDAYEKHLRESEELSQSKRKLQALYEQLQDNFTSAQKDLLDQLKQKEIVLAEYSQMVQDLKDTVEKKQQQITKLEASVADLTFEVKTLLQLSDYQHDTKIPEEPSEVEEKPNKSKVSPFPTNTRSPYALDSIETTNLARGDFENRNISSQEALAELRRCIDVAQKLTGASHFDSTGRFRDLSIDNYALDQRRLFDSLRSENRCAVLVYSPKDEKLLFVNNQIKNILGWSPERFIQDFPSLIKEGHEEWKKALQNLSTQYQSSVRLLLKNRTGYDQIINGQLGIISFGLFKGHVIGVFYTP